MSRKKTGGRDFQVGNAGGPGRPPVPQEINEALSYTRAQLVEAITRYMTMSLLELKACAKDESLSAASHLIIRILITGIMKGDQARMDFLLSRVMGSVKQVVEHVGEARPQSRVVDDMHKELVMLLIGTKATGLLNSGDS